MSIDIPILFEDKNYLVINKPAGLVVHADGRTTEPTVVDWILEHHPEMKEVGEPLKIRIFNKKSETDTNPDFPEETPEQALQSEQVVFRPGIVHRIDRDTSGVLVIAKNQESFLHLKEQFQNWGVDKIYNAFAYGQMHDEDGVIDRPIARSKKDFRLWSAQRGARGEVREAVTHYKVLATTNLDRDDLGFSYLELSPKTGRTHQIRVHLKAINHPIIADPLYAPKRKAALGFKRLALHARSISFKSLAGKQITVEAPYPADFEVAIKKLKG